MLIVLIISILFFIFIRSDVVWIKYTIRLILIPVIAGVSYEIIRLAGSSDNFIVNLMNIIIYDYHYNCFISVFISSTAGDHTLGSLPITCRAISRPFSDCPLSKYIFANK